MRDLSDNRLDMRLAESIGLMLEHFTPNGDYSSIENEIKDFLMKLKGLQQLLELDKGARLRGLVIYKNTITTG